MPVPISICCSRRTRGRLAERDVRDQAVLAGEVEEDAADAPPVRPCAVRRAGPCALPVLELAGAERHEVHVVGPRLVDDEALAILLELRADLGEPLALGVARDAIARRRLGVLEQPHGALGVEQRPDRAIGLELQRVLELA